MLHPGGHSARVSATYTDWFIPRFIFWRTPPRYKPMIPAEDSRTGPASKMFFRKNRIRKTTGINRNKSDSGTFSPWNKIVVKLRRDNDDDDDDDDDEVTWPSPDRRQKFGYGRKPGSRDFFTAAVNIDRCRKRLHISGPGKRIGSQKFRWGCRPSSDRKFSPPPTFLSRKFFFLLGQSSIESVLVTWSSLTYGRNF